MDKQNNFGFQYKMQLPNKLRNVLGQVVVLNVYDNSGKMTQVALPIGKLQSETLPYHFKNRHEDEDIEKMKTFAPVLDDNVTKPLLFGFFSLTVLMAMIFYTAYRQFK